MHNFILDTANFDTPTVTNFDKSNILNSKIGKNCSIINSRIKNCIILDNCNIVNSDLEDCFVYENCTIKSSSLIEKIYINANCRIINSVLLEQVTIGQSTTVGPFAHIHNEVDIGDKCRIGNFVEMKKADFGAGSKASHLTYVGDAQVGQDVNFGCGTITSNYDGKNKSLTKIEDNVFIGCNTNLVAPVTVRKNAYIAAGSTITKEVDEDAMAIARARQENKQGYSKILKEIREKEYERRNKNKK